MPDAPTRTFDFSARPPAGGPLLRSSLDAEDADAAAAAVAAMGLTPEAVTPAGSLSPAPPGGADFFCFNQQLAHLTRAGLPVEPGLRLLARDAGRGRLGRGIAAVADDLDAGLPLAEAIDRHRSAFPPLYATLVDAGVRTGRLPDVLLNLGRHLQHSRRLSAAVWQAGAYPLVVLFVLLLVTGFLAGVVIPGFEGIYEDFGTEMPALTLLTLGAADWLPAAVIACGVLVFGLVGLGLLARWTGHGPLLRDLVLRRLPLLGPAITQGLLARWCDLVAVGVRAGLDLPAALDLAGDATGSRPLAADGRALGDALNEGLPVDAATGLRLLPRPVTLAMAHGAVHATLPEAMDDLATLYGGQAEMRLLTLHTALGPLFFGLLAVLIGVVAVALFLPLVRLMSSLT